MHVALERPGDAPAIRAIVRAAFAVVAHSRGTEAAIVDGLRDAGALPLSLVAVEDGAVIGHAAFSPVTIDGADRGWFGLGPLAVAPERQRRGAGMLLVREGLALLEAREARGCVVLGSPGYYGRFGFGRVDGLVYPGAPAAYFQAVAFGGEAAAGRVDYHPAFDAG